MISCVYAVCYKQDRHGVHQDTCYGDVVCARSGNVCTDDDEEKSTKKAVKQVKEKLEKTTLGDITELAALKEQMTADAAAAKEENKD